MQLCSNVLGNHAGTTFYKKYLLVKNGGLNGGAFPIDLGKRNYEVVETSEIWLKTQEKNEIERSIQKKGSNKAYTYTLKSVVEEKG
jgi:hypothetical protein